jgi:hypothetical protein
MQEKWEKRIEEAQKDQYYKINNKKYKRIPFGKEEEDPWYELETCGECSVKKDSYM